MNQWFLTFINPACSYVIFQIFVEPLNVLHDDVSRMYSTNLKPKKQKFFTRTKLINIAMCGQLLRILWSWRGQNDVRSLLEVNHIFTKNVYFRENVEVKTKIFCVLNRDAAFRKDLDNLVRWFSIDKP